MFNCSVLSVGRIGEDHEALRSRLHWISDPSRGRAWEDGLPFGRVVGFLVLCRREIWLGMAGYGWLFHLKYMHV
jgi:hypothetical protein